jgi:hypothetical protein
LRTRALQGKTAGVLRPYGLGLLCTAMLMACAADAAQPSGSSPSEGERVAASLRDGRPGFCARSAYDAVWTAFCEGPTPALRSLRDLQQLLEVEPAERVPPQADQDFYDPGVVSNVVAMSHSTALSGQLVSSINPRVIIFGSAVYMAFQRGVQRVELASRSDEPGAFNFYLVSFQQACNAGPAGCAPGDLYTPRIESDWTEVAIEDAEDLKNTPQDCRQCHQRDREHGGLLMRELESPWTHFFERDRMAANTLPGVRGDDLLREYLHAKGDEAYGGVDMELISNTSALVLENLAGRAQPLVFDARSIERERWPTVDGAYVREPRPSPTWEKGYEAFQRGEQLALPYVEPSAADPDKLAQRTEAYRRYRAGELAASELPDLGDIFPDDPRLRARIGLSTEPDAGAASALIQACGACHNDVLDQSLSRARFSVDVSRLSRSELDAAIERIERPATAPGVMPPKEARQLDAETRERVIAHLRAGASSLDPDGLLERAAELGMTGGALERSGPVR